MAERICLFHQRGPEVGRKEIPVGEVLFGVFFVLFLIALAVWFASKKDDFRPEDRDISMALLAEGAVRDTLYRAPVKRWVDPAAAASGGAAAALGIFPGEILAGDWRPASRVQRFNRETLYEKIDGAAEQYFQYGFVELHFLSIEQSQSGLALMIEVYDMGSFQNALGIFAAQRDAEQAVSDRGPARYYPTGAGAIGILGGFYLKMSGNSEAPAVQEKALQIVDLLSGAKSGSAQTPHAFRVLADLLGVPFDAIAYERSDVFQYDFAKDFWFGRPDKASEQCYYLHEAASEEEAQALFDQLLENHRYDYEVLEVSRGEALLQHQFLETFMSLNRRGTLVFGIDNAPDQDALGASLDTLTEALSHDEDA